MSSLNYQKFRYSNMDRMSVPFVYQGITFLTVENFYQAMKFPKEDVTSRAYVASLNSYDAKKYGKSAPYRSDWNDMRLKVMEYAIQQKFADGTNEASQLRSDDTIVIAELNIWHDNFWGICKCMSIDNSRFGKRNTCTGTGHNMLGKLIMAQRKKLLG